MHVISNAFLSQAEVTQVDRWEHGPLEIHLVPETSPNGFGDVGYRVFMWNSTQCAGFLRDSESVEWLESIGLASSKNPNLVVAPTRSGYSELLGMLGSLLPDHILSRHNISRPKANFWLWPCSEEMKCRSPANFDRHSRDELNRLTDAHLQRLSSIIPSAFEDWIWQQLVGSKRFGIQNFAKNSSLRLLAGDVRFWMHRLYRVAIDLYESFQPTTHEDEEWHSLDEIERQMNEYIPADERASFQLTRPRMGGHLWYPDDADDREWITELLIEGDATVESLEPIVEALLGSATHEDFSDRYSWIKEDFERAFYSKRSRVKVKLHEFIDECPVHEGTDTPGYENILFRDLMAFFDERDRTIILALRQGKTRSEIAEQLGHSGHASVSRRVKLIESKMQRLLGNH